MSKKVPLTFPSLFSESVRKFGNHNALTFVGEEPYTYEQLNNQISSLIAMFEKIGIKQDDKVAILSVNMPNWGIIYLATTFMKAVAVPMLPDFNADEIENILSHSEAKAIFVSKCQAAKIKNIRTKYLKHRFNIEDFSVIGHDTPDIVFDPELRQQSNYQVEEDDLAAIIYTSGTTGKSKGVMLSQKNISVNALAGIKVQPVDNSDRLLSVLPLSHTYENTIGFVLPMIAGACVYYLRKPPSPTVLMPALKSVQPTIMLTVPLIIDKIYRKSVLPTFQNKAVTRYLYGIPVTRKGLNILAGKKLKRTFGGKLKFYGVGGAKLDKAVEQFLLEARFPYAVGYGLTETAPLLAGCNPQMSRLESTGPPVDRVQLKIHNPDKETGEGEVWARGPNVMRGYYKEPEQTSEVLTEDGWFKTGDLGVFDNDNYLFIKGRKKNMIVGASGENIYPEEIESVINNFGYVVESLVIEHEGKLVAMVHFNKEELINKYKHLKQDVAHLVEEKIEELRKELHIHVNKKVNKFSRIQSVVLQPIPFKKTATKKIKRFLYSV